jgi:hypothetical protein
VRDTLKPRQLRQIEHLARLRLHDRRLSHIPPTAIAHLNPVQHRPIGILATLEMMTLMPRLTARLATRPTTQTPDPIHSRLRVPIRRRRPRRVPRVLIELGTQLRDDYLQLRDPGGLRSHQLLELGIRRGDETSVASSMPQDSLRNAAILLNQAARRPE